MNLARRLFFWGSMLFVLAGIAHFFGQFGARNPDGQTITSLMKAYRPGGAGFSQWDIQEAFGAGFGFLIIWIGVSGLLFGTALGQRPAELRTSSLFYAIAAAGIGAITAAYGIFPPVAVVSPSLLLFLAAFFATPRHIS